MIELRNCRISGPFFIVVPPGADDRVLVEDCLIEGGTLTVLRRDVVELLDSSPADVAVAVHGLFKLVTDLDDPSG